MSENQLRRLSVLGEKLKAQGRWITCAESCTGGGIAKAITDIAGSSAYFDRGFVTYSNAAKHDLLGERSHVGARRGQRRGGARDGDRGAAGGAGRSGAIGERHRRPDGGSAEKPVGTVWFSFAGSDGRGLSRMMQFEGDRDAVRLQATIFALQTAIDEFL